MIPINQITEEVLEERANSLPDSLQQLLADADKSKVVEGFCHRNYIVDAEKILIIQQIIALTLMGFINISDLADEITAETGLRKELGTDIAKEADAKIFEPVKTVLSTVYSPIINSSKTDGGKKINEVNPPQIATIPAPSSSIISGPKIISESFAATPNVAMTSPRSGASLPPPKPTSTQSVISQTAKDISLGATPISSSKNIATPPIPQSGKVGVEQGWSRQTQQDPVVKLGVITPNMPKPMAPATPIEVPSQPRPAAQPKTISEFDRLGIVAKGAIPPSASVAPAKPTTSQISPPRNGSILTPAPAKPPEPAPIMLHEVGTSAPVNQNFRINQGVQNQMRGMPAQAPMPPKPAILEFGGTPTQSTETPKSISKVVHYSEYKTTSPPTPSMPTSADPRNVTEITAAAAMMPTKNQVTAPPPTPGTPPTTKPKEKVIMKDYK